MMWLIIGIIYLVLTGAAIFFAADDGSLVQTGISWKEKAVRVFFLMAIGWFSTILLGIGAVVVWTLMTIQDNLLSFQSDKLNNFSLLSFIGKQLKKLIFWKKEGAKSCSTDSQVEQKESWNSPTEKPIDSTTITSGQNISSLDLSKKEAESQPQSSGTLE